ncbi:MAG: hypothetical protein NC310_03060 [Roseburia sp.]|nr:hypothetical protein [Anaeroplasma bactoclasticum]MCM1196038.1 hypothetical protein [Roseburia sp.]MCM1557069.1 hypothetical protein [Anaeroplasma bactoclasticum]
MDSKEKLRKGIKIRLIVMSLSAVLPIILLVLFSLPFFKKQFVVYSDLFFLRYAIFVLLEGYIGFKIYRYIRFFCDTEYADFFVLRKTDERLNYIRLKTNAMVIKIFIYVCGIALIIAGFFNSAVFYTLLSILCAVLLIYLFVYLVYSKKY